MDIPTVTMTAQQMADLPTGTMSCTPPNGAEQDLDGIIRWKQRSVGCKSGFVLCEKPVEGHVQWSVIALVPGSSNEKLSGGIPSAQVSCSACGGTPELHWSRHDAMKWIECKCGRGVEEYDTFPDADVWAKWDKQNARLDRQEETR